MTLLAQLSQPAMPDNVRVSIAVVIGIITVLWVLALGRKK